MREGRSEKQLNSGKLSGGMEEEMKGQRCGEGEGRKDKRTEERRYASTEMKLG